MSTLAGARVLAAEPDQAVRRAEVCPRRAPSVSSQGPSRIQPLSPLAHGYVMELAVSVGIRAACDGEPSSGRSQQWRAAQHARSPRPQQGPHSDRGGGDRRCRCEGAAGSFSRALRCYGRQLGDRMDAE
jgi:hypothetical protein